MLVAGVLPVAVPFARFVNPSAVSDTFGLLPWWWLQDQRDPLSRAAVRRARRRARRPPRSSSSRGAFALVPVALVAVYFVLASAIVENGRHGIRQASVGGLFAGIRLAAPRLDRPARRPQRRRLVRLALRGRDAAALEQRVLQPQRPYGLHRRRPRPGRRRPAGDAGARAALTAGSPRPAGRRRASATRSPTRTSRARSSRATPGSASPSTASNGPIVILTRIRGLYANDTWSGRRVTYRRLRCTGGQLSVRLGTDAHLFSANQVVTAIEKGRTVASIEIAPDRPADARAFRSIRTPHGVCTVDFTTSTVRVPAQRAAGQQGHAQARRPLLLLRLLADENRLRRQPALARAHGRQQLHPRLARRARGGGGRARRRDRRVRADVAGRQARDPGGARRASTSSSGSCALPFAHAWRTAVVEGAAPRRRALARLVRRAALQRLDVSAAAATACARRRSTTSCPSTIPNGRPDEREAMHGRKYENAAATCDVVFANSAFTADDFATHVLVSARARARREPGDRSRVHRRRAGRRARRRVPADRRDARAAQEPRHARRRVRAARRHRPVARRRGRQRLGRAAGARPARDRPARPRHRRRARTALPRAPRRSSIRRGSKGSGCRSPRRWRPARRSSPRRTRRWTRRPATPPCAPIPRARRRSPTPFARRSRGATELRALGLEHVAAILLAARGRDLPRGVRAIRVALDTTPLVQTRAGTARYVRALRDGLGVDARRAAVPRDLAGCGPPPPMRSGTRACARRPAPTCCTARRFAARSVRAGRSSSRCTISPCCGIPEWFNRWTATYSRLAVPRVLRAATRLIAVSEFTKRRARVALLGVDAGEDRRRAERRSRTSSPPTARGPRATTRSRSGRSSRARTSARIAARGRRRAAGRRRARLGRCRPAAERDLARRRLRRASWPRSTAARAASSTPRSTRASGSPSPRRWPAAARS